MKNPIKFFFDRTETDTHVPNIDLLFHSAGLAGQNMTYGFTNNWWFLFCNDILHIDPKQVGMIQSVSKLWDAVNDPLIGSFVDKHRFKSGEKLRPYLLVTPPVIGILSAMMFMNFTSNAMVSLIIMLILYFFWDLIYSFQDTALWGIMAVSSPHSEERSRIAQWISIGAGAGSALVGVFPLMKGENVLSALHMTPAGMYLVGGLVFGLGGELLSMMAYRQKERVRSESRKGDSLKDIFRGLFQNKVLLTISLARFLQQVTPALDWEHFFVSSVEYNVGSMHIDGGTAQFLYGLIIGAPGALCMFAATKIANKMGGMKKLLVISQFLSIGLRVICYTVGYQSIGRMAVVMVLMAVVSIPCNMMDIAHRSLTSDSIDYIEWKTGVRNEGISFSIQNFISKMQSSVSSLIKGFILNALKYDSYVDKNKQNPVYLKWQWPIFMLGPVIGSVLYLIAISFVKDDKELKARVEKELGERRRAQLNS